MKQLFTQFGPPWNNLMLLMTILLVVFVLHTALFLILKATLARNRFVNYSDLKVFRPPTLTLSILLVINYGLKLFEYQETWALNIIEVFVILQVVWLAIVGVSFSRKVLTRKLRMDEEDNLKARKLFTELKVAERILTVLIIILGVGSALMTFPSIRQLGASILTTAGIAGIIVGLAAQRVIGGIFAGLQLAITQTIRIDDVVIVEDEWGKIEEIGLTYVVVKIWDKRRLVLPTTYFIEKPFQNWTRISADLIGTVFIYTDYRIPVSALREELTQILKNTPLWDQDVNVLQVTDATDRSVELRALVSAKNSNQLWDLRVHVREQLMKFLQENYEEFLPKTRIELSNPIEKIAS